MEYSIVSFDDLTHSVTIEKNCKRRRGKGRGTRAGGMGRGKRIRACGLFYRPDSLGGGVVRPCRRSVVCLSTLQKYLRLAKPTLSLVENQDWRAGRGQLSKRPLVRPFIGRLRDQTYEITFFAAVQSRRSRALIGSAPAFGPASGNWRALPPDHGKHVLIYRSCSSSCSERRGDQPSPSTVTPQLPTRNAPSSSTSCCVDDPAFRGCTLQRRRSRNVLFEALVPAVHD